MDDTEQDQEKEPAARRASMLARLEQVRGWPLADDVRQAMLVVPRHEFVPDAPLSQAYGMGAVVTHRDTGKTVALFRCTQMILWP